ncbi:MAG: hypothetical protein LUE25_05325 [Clostridiales bacterium]|nr:hypothetical protein [Clostridiales bacterium]
MKTKFRIISVAAALAVTISLCPFIFAADSDYDSSTDPLISYSYLEERLSELQEEIESLQSEILSVDNSSLETRLTELESRISDIESEISELAAQLAKIDSGSSSSSSSSGSDFVEVQFTKGDIIYATGGALELVLRSGSAVVVSSSSTLGLCDMSLGIDIMNGGLVVYNHLLLIPKGDDERGIKITSSTASIMLRGSYYVVEG